jgi:hypothetical protein
VGESDFYCGFGDSAYAITQDNNIENDGKWHFGAIVWNNTGAKCYLDANSTGTYSFALVEIDQEIEIGRAWGGNYFNGTIDDVMIFNRSLSAEEVMYLYANQSNRYATQNFTSLADGNHTFKAYTQDRAGNVNSTETRTATVDTTDPVIKLDNPTNDTWQTTQSITFKYTPTDAHLKNCTLYGNFGGTWAANQSNATVTSGSQDTITLTLTNGTYLWNVLCYDYSGNNAFNSTNYTVSVDSVILDITLNAADNSYSTSNTYVNFNWTVIDNLDDNMTCNVTINSTVNVSNIGALNNTPTNYSISGFTSGDYAWNITCWDSANNTNTSITRTFTIDTATPSVTLNKPENDTYFNQTNVVFNYTPSGNNLDACVLWGDWSGSWAKNETNSTPISGLSIIVNLTLTNGYYTWNAICNNTAGTTAWGANSTFGVDTVYPTISFENPTDANNSNISTDAIYVNVSVNDTNNVSTFVDLDNSLVGWWRMDDVNQTGEGALVYDKSIYGNNGTAQANAKQTDAGYLGKGFEFDGDGDYIQTNSIPFGGTQFSFSFWFKAYPNTVYILVWGSFGDRACRVGGVTANKLNCPVDASSADSVTSTTSVNDGNWYHVVIASNSTAQQLYINGINEANATETLDNDSGVIVMGSLNFGSNPLNGTLDDVMVFNRSLSAEEAAALYANQSNRYLVENYTGLTDGNHTFKAYTQDRAGNVNSTEERTATIDTTSPTTSLDSPTNDSWQTSQSVTFKYTPTDAHLKNCTLYGNFGGSWAANQSNLTVTSGSQDTITLTLTNGTYLWNVQCYDYMGNSAFNSTNYTIHVDSIIPDISLNAPIDQYNTSDTYVDFNWTVVDNLDSSLLCNLTLNGTVNVSNIVSSNGTATNQTVEGFNAGTYYWNITCWDNASNVNTSITRQFKIDAGPPYFDNYAVNDTILGLNEVARFSVDVYDSDSNVNYVNGTINGTTYNFSQGAGDQWYYDWQCTTSIPDVNFTYVGANDSLGNWNDTSVENVTTECDAVAPSVSNENKTPEPSYNSNNVTLNATVTDTEGNIDTVWINGNWTGSWVNYTDGVINVSSIYSYTVMAGNFSNQESVGWRYYANDTAGNLQEGTLQNFTVQNRAPSNVSLLSPANATITADNTTFFNWTNATDPDGDSLTYTLQVDNDSDFSSVTVEKTGLTDSNYTLSSAEELTQDVYYWRVYSNDSYTTNVSLMWQFEINPGQAVGATLSTNLSNVMWIVTSLPQINLDALGNNVSGTTWYNVTIDATGTTADLYVKGNANLTSGSNFIDLSNEKITYNLTDPTVPVAVKSSLTTDYSDNPIGSNLADGTVVYLKFFLNVSGSQAPGVYNNTITFKVVPYGGTP